MAVHEQQHTDVDIDAAAVIAGLRVELESLRNKYEILSARHDALLRKLYGKRSERYSVDGEEPLFAGLENPEAPPPPHVDEAPDAEEPDDEPRGRGAKERRHRGASRIPADIRRVVEVVEPTPEELRCPCCDDDRERHVIGYEETERLEYEPASVFVRVIRRPKLACPLHEEAGIVTPELPAQVIEKGLAGASMLAQVVTAKAARPPAAASSDRHLRSPRRRSRAVDVVRLDGRCGCSDATHRGRDAGGGDRLGLRGHGRHDGHAAAEGLRAEEQPTVAPLGLCGRAAGRRRVRLHGGSQRCRPRAHPGGLRGLSAGGRLLGLPPALHRSPDPRGGLHGACASQVLRRAGQLFGTLRAGLAGVQAPLPGRTPGQGGGPHSRPATRTSDCRIARHLRFPPKLARRAEGPRVAEEPDRQGRRHLDRNADALGRFP
ncbi:MAG: IS66 family transposase zinc-finger binding domain-containing protein [Planctomycetes bacterium]|nr:IS66 family transposase zinc-finger binding domain-containing protein [Planctomycetota bacterium]